MSATLLANELSALSSDAKRKNPELRNAADKSLQELKALPATSEQQLAAGKVINFVAVKFMLETRQVARNHTPSFISTKQSGLLGHQHSCADWKEI